MGDPKNSTTGPHPDRAIGIQKCTFGVVRTFIGSQKCGLLEIARGQLPSDVALPGGDDFK